MAHHPHWAGGGEDEDIADMPLGGTIAVRVPRTMLGPAVPLSAELQCFLSHQPPPPPSSSLPSSAPETLPGHPAEDFKTVFERVSRFTLEELAALADTLPASLRPSASQLLLSRLSAATAPPAEVPSAAAAEEARLAHTRRTKSVLSTKKVGRVHSTRLRSNAVRDRTGADVER